MQVLAEAIDAGRAERARGHDVGERTERVHDEWKSFVFLLEVSFSRCKPCRQVPRSPPLEKVACLCTWPGIRGRMDDSWLVLPCLPPPLSPPLPPPLPKGKAGPTHVGVDGEHEHGAWLRPHEEELTPRWHQLMYGGRSAPPLRCVRRGGVPTLLLVTTSVAGSVACTRVHVHVVAVVPRVGGSSGGSGLTCPRPARFEDMVEGGSTAHQVEDSSYRVCGGARAYTQGCS